MDWAVREASEKASFELRATDENEPVLEKHVPSVRGGKVQVPGCGRGSIWLGCNE